MKKIFKKAMTVFGTFALVGATISGAAAAAYPSPFTANSAVVYGASAATSDMEAATDIVDALNVEFGVEEATSGSLEGGESIFEDEVVLGTSIVSGDIPAIVTSGSGKSRISSLMKEKLSWDDGTGSSDYDIEERILIGDMKVITRLDDKNLKEDVALTNQQGLEYQLYFKSLFNRTAVGTDDADTLYLTILGEEYEIKSIPSADSITVVTSEQFSLGVGQSATVDGKTFTVDSIFGESVEVNGEIVTGSKKIDGMRVEVDTIGYHSNAPEQSRVVLKIGEDISKTYTSGEEYIGEDDKDPLWTWNINMTQGAESWIGVKYAANIDKEKAPVAGDVIKYLEDAYVFPSEFGQVSLDSLTEVNYEDLTIYFEEGTNLYNNSDSSEVFISDANVIVIEGADTDTITVDGKETDRIYIYLNGTTDFIEAYYRDWDGDFIPSGRTRLVNASALNVSANNEGTIATFAVGDTDLEIVMNVTGGDYFLKVVNTDDSDSVVLMSAISATFDQFGSDAEGTATAGDAVFSGEEVSTQEYNYVDAYGIKIAEDSTVKSQVEDDRIILSIPDEQVFAKVSVTVGGEVVEDEESSTGVKIYKDTESASFADKNIVVVGGSAINAIAADLLGGKLEGAAFTEATTVDAGKFLIESFTRNGKTALLVAGYNAADTEMGVTYLINEGVDTTVGNKYVGTSGTSATLVTA